MLKNHIYSQTKKLFEKKLNAEEVPENAIAFIEDSKEIWTNGTYFGGSNIQAVDTGDVLDDVNVDYATKAYVDGLIGDINSVLESIILFPITINFNGGDRNNLRQVCNFLIKKYGTSYGITGTPLNISEEIYLQEFGGTGDGQVKFMTIKENGTQIELYLGDYESTGYCCLLLVHYYITITDFLWD